MFICVHPWLHFLSHRWIWPNCAQEQSTTCAHTVPAQRRLDCASCVVCGSFSADWPSSADRWRKTRTQGGPVASQWRSGRRNTRLEGADQHEDQRSDGLQVDVRLHRGRRTDVSSGSQDPRTGRSAERCRRAAPVLPDQSGLRDTAGPLARLTANRSVGRDSSRRKRWWLASARATLRVRRRAYALRLLAIFLAARP